MMRFLLGTAALVALAVAWPAVSAAQMPPAQPSVESMPIRFGALGLAPTFSITDMGVDSNVFNDPDNPQEDFSATFVPRLVARLRMGHALLSFGSAADLVYFHEFEGERSSNATTDIRVDAELGRLHPYATASWTDTRQRFNAEIDARAPRQQEAYGAGARLLLASRTILTLGVRQQDLRFDQGWQFRGVDLSETLNSRTRSAEAGIQLILTPLTTFGITGSVQQDRFTNAPGRDSDSFRILPAFQFDPTSLLRGTVALGYRRFRPLSPELPGYRGLVVQTSAGYTLNERTRFDLDVLRDVQYSYEEAEPYYLSTGGRLSVTQMLVGMLDAQVFGGRQNLSYRTSGSDGESRTDRVEVIGAGMGYHIRETWRMSVNWEYSRRHSAAHQHQYDRRRVFASLTIGS